MGTTYEEDSNLSILLRYSSDNDYPDMIFTSKPIENMEETHSDSGSPPPPAPVFRNSEDRKYELEQEKEKLVENDTLETKSATETQETIPPITTKPQIDPKHVIPLKTVVCKLHNLDIKKLPKSFFKKKSHVFLHVDGKTVEYKKSKRSTRRGCFCWVSQCANTMRRSFEAVNKFHQRIMDWMLLYSGRPSGNFVRRDPDGISVADQESKQAEDFVNNNMDVPLEELAKQNLELQKQKELEYEQKRNKKAPSLEDQPRGENGRIIFSQEYIDYMLYRDLQPLVDLRVLKKTEEVIKRKINERDAAKIAVELEEKAKIEENAVVRQGRVARVIRKVFKWTIDLSHRCRLRTC